MEEMVWDKSMLAPGMAEHLERCIIPLGTYCYTHSLSLTVFVCINLYLFICLTD